MFKYGKNNTRSHLMMADRRQEIEQIIELLREGIDSEEPEEVSRLVGTKNSGIQSNFICDTCKKTYTLQRNLRKHLKEKHGVTTASPEKPDLPDLKTKHTNMNEEFSKIDNFQLILSTQQAFADPPTPVDIDCKSSKTDGKSLFQTHGCFDDCTSSSESEDEHNMMPPPQPLRSNARPTSVSSTAAKPKAGPPRLTSDDDIAKVRKVLKTAPPIATTTTIENGAQKSKKDASNIDHASNAQSPISSRNGMKPIENQQPAINNSYENCNGCKQIEEFKRSISECLKSEMNRVTLEFETLKSELNSTMRPLREILDSLLQKQSTVELKTPSVDVGMQSVQKQFVDCMSNTEPVCMAAKGEQTVHRSENSQWTSTSDLKWGIEKCVQSMLTEAKGFHAIAVQTDPNVEVVSSNRENEQEGELESLTQQFMRDEAPAYLLNRNQSELGESLNVSELNESFFLDSLKTTTAKDEGTVSAEENHQEDLAPPSPELECFLQTQNQAQSPSTSEAKNQCLNEDEIDKIDDFGSLFLSQNPSKTPETTLPQNELPETSKGVPDKSPVKELPSPTTSKNGTKVSAISIMKKKLSNITEKQSSRSPLKRKLTSTETEKSRSSPDKRQKLAEKPLEKVGNDSITESQFASAILEVENDSDVVAVSSTPYTEKNLNSQSGLVVRNQTPYAKSMQPETPQDASDALESTSVASRRISKSDLKPLHGVYVAVSLINKPELAKIKGVCRELGAVFDRNMTEQTTHVLIKREEDASAGIVCQRTAKYLEAISRGLWIVDFKWIMECGKAKKRLGELKFEMTGEKVCGDDHKGPSLARQCTNKGERLLLRYMLHCPAEFQDMSLEFTEKIVTNAGGIYVQNRQDFKQASTDRKKVIVADYDCSDLVRQIGDECGVPVISQEWLIDSITRYRLLSRRDHVIHYVRPSNCRELNDTLSDWS